MRLMILLAGCMLLAACAEMPQKVTAPVTQAKDKTYTLDLPVGWVRWYTIEGNLVASRDGPLLQNLAVVHRPLKDAFQRTKKSATENMLPAELAEKEIAEIKARDELTAALEVLENEPATLAGREGFRVKVGYRTQRGLEVVEVVYGIAEKTGIYLVAYRAPKLYYFDTYYPEFEKSVGSFKLSTTKA